MSRFALLFVALLAVAPSAVAGEPLPPDQLRDDLRILRETLERAHATLYRYSSREQLDAMFAAAERAVATPTTDRDFYRILLPLIDSIHDLHTVIRPPAATNEVLAKANVFPLDIRYAGDTILEFTLSLIQARRDPKTH